MYLIPGREPIEEYKNRRNVVFDDELACMHLLY